VYGRYVDDGKATGVQTLAHPFINYPCDDAIANPSAREFQGLSGASRLNEELPRRVFVHELDDASDHSPGPIRGRIHEDGDPPGGRLADGLLFWAHGFCKFYEKKRKQA
jgi:hypothetical protein